jgi:hypothetical protein
MTKHEIKDWLDKSGKDRAWLAQQVGCTIGTLNQWFSKLGFPEWALLSIERLANPQQDKTCGLEVTFTAREFDRIEEARKLSGQPTRAEYYTDAILEYTDHILATEKFASQSAGQGTIVTSPVASRSNITHLNPLEHHHIAADEPSDTSDMPTPTKVSYGSGKSRKNRA